MTTSDKVAAPALAIAVAGLLLTAPAVLAEESGSFNLFQSFTHDYTTIDHADGTITSGSLKGTSTVLQSSSEPFVEGATHLLRCLAYAQDSESGIDIRGACTMTDASGDNWFALVERTTGDVQEGGGGEGRWKLVGGTGKFDGISGSCSYNTEYLPDAHVVSTKDCTWKR